MKKNLVIVCRVLVGLLFIFSGLIKQNDPLGFGYKLQEYFEVFHMMFLYDYATAIAILLCALEIILGAALLLGLRGKQVAWGLLLLIIFFTFLTFYSAYFDVVRTCGCFGDAIPLTPWQSFSKDLVLLLLILVIFFNWYTIRPLIHSGKAQDLSLIIITVLAVGFGLYTYNFLPVMDFLPYKTGKNIPEQMKVPVGAPQDEFEITYTLKNKKSGESKKMTDKEYLKTEIWKDTTWEIVGEPENKLIKKGFEVKIKDLKVTDAFGTDYTKEIFESPNYNLIIVAYDLGKTNLKAIGDLNALAINAAENYNIRSVLLTSATPEAAEKFRKGSRLPMEIFYCDAVPLKSMVRANPGLMLIKNGIVINKWHYHLLPSYTHLDHDYFQKGR
ncbi:MAG: DoxX family protein [Sphingobacteriaceae bacterium]|jgi:uncharacterized membrane protein YphA (DoxX/SURF4 family)|nr:DoxX family protein [Sphingobacteriaceae bacterium]